MSRRNHHSPTHDRHRRRDNWDSDDDCAEEEEDGDGRAGHCS